MNGNAHHFSVGGLYNGLALLIDDETRTYWDHITGEAVHGPLRGTQLEVWPIRLTTVAAALARDPELEVSISRSTSLVAWLARLGYRNKLHGGNWLPPFFRRTMTEGDKRMPELAQGLGVVHAGEARYYPITRIPEGGLQETWAGRIITVRRDEVDRVPYAFWADDGSWPFQLLSRWYGFSITFPGCSIFGDEGESGGPRR